MHHIPWRLGCHFKRLCCNVIVSHKVADTTMLSSEQVPSRYAFDGVLNLAATFKVQKPTCIHKCLEQTCIDRTQIKQNKTHKLGVADQKRMLVIFHGSSFHTFYFFSAVKTRKTNFYISWPSLLILLFQCAHYLTHRLYTQTYLSELDIFLQRLNRKPSEQNILWKNLSHFDVLSGHVWLN